MEQSIYNRLHRPTGVFESYVTEGDGIRQAAEQGRSVYDISGANAEKQAEQFEQMVGELLGRIQSGVS